jgi:tRNA modification GTPase
MSTIVALSTPRGRGALAVVRLSGPLAMNIVTQMAELGDIEPRKAKLTKLTKDDQIIDEVILICFNSHLLSCATLVDR